jgi:hypothetical protein
VAFKLFDGQFMPKNEAFRAVFLRINSVKNEEKMVDFFTSFQGIF